MGIRNLTARLEGKNTVLLSWQRPLIVEGLPSSYKMYAFLEQIPDSPEASPVFENYFLELPVDRINRL